MFSQIVLSLVCVALGFSIQLIINNDNSTSSVTNMDTKKNLYMCGENEKNSLIISPTTRERITGKLEKETITRAVSVFRKCGAVAINSAVSSRAIDDFEYHLNHMMSPLLESRERIKQVSKHKTSWDQLSNLEQSELFLASGEGIRERQSGRLDLLLPHTMPFNSTEVILNKYTMPILHEIFDHQLFELKSVHGVISLPGTKAQKWHRDDGPLFPQGDNLEDLANKKEKSKNVYAINAFIALKNVKLENGPTEYMTGSHLETNHDMKLTLSEEHQSGVCNILPLPYLIYRIFDIFSIFTINLISLSISVFGLFDIFSIFTINPYLSLYLFLVCL